jgi:hypothetical protein
MPVADTLTTAVRLADKIASDIPRNLDIATLRYAIHQLAAQRPAAVPVRKRRRRIVPLHYWRDRKRIQPRPRQGRQGRGRGKLEQLACVADLGPARDQR